ncbi:hypothetical protein HanRHA438_Chr04g0170071 [Helianthus annuus]|nr:hypothetical protein HanRHA438_Chr04g0170071 [Helianthus annuus]
MTETVERYHMCVMNKLKGAGGGGSRKFARLLHLSSFHALVTFLLNRAIFISI